jgi:AAA domain
MTRTPTAKCAKYRATSPMINNISIKNFRCLKEFSVQDCSLVNVIVGENGVGKTAILEAVFMALSGGTEIGLRYRQQRGLDGNFAGTPRSIEDSFYADLFTQRETSNPIQISLEGDGSETRSLVVSKGPTQQLFTTDFRTQSLSNQVFSPINFTWHTHLGQDITVATVVGPNGIQFGSTNEDLPDYFYFSTGAPVGSIENATRFSDLSRVRREDKFVKQFIGEYPWIEDLSIEIVGGAPAIHASISGLHEKIPVANVSGAINRILGVLLSMASRDRSVVLVDELENGVYFKHYNQTWNTILNCCRQYNSQLFTTTHSLEWIKSLVEVSSENIKDVTLWRIERTDKSPVLRKFSGDMLKAGIEVGGELR